MTMFRSALGSSLRPLTLPQNFVAKREVISTYFGFLFGSEFSFVWGGKGGDASVTNASEKVPTINKLFGTLLLW